MEMHCPPMARGTPRLSLLLIAASSWAWQARVHSRSLLGGCGQLSRLAAGLLPLVTSVFLGFPYSRSERPCSR